MIKLPSLTIGARLLLWFLVIALMPLMVVTLLSYVNSVQILQKSVLTSLETVAFNKSQLIESFLLERKSEVTTLANLPEITGMIRALQSLDAGSTEANTIIEQVRPFLLSYVSQADYRDLILLTRDGRVLYNLNRRFSPGSNLFRRPYRDNELALVVNRTRTLLKTELSAFRLLGEGDATAYIVAPVIKNEQMIGLVVLQLSSDALFSAVTNPLGLGETGETITVEQENDRLIFTAPLRSDPESAFRRTIDNVDSTSLMGRAAAGETGAGIAQDYRGVDVVAVWRMLPSLKWGMVVQQDAAEAFAPVEVLRHQALVLALVTMVVVLVLASLVARSLTVPVVRITRAVKAVSGGQLSARAPQYARRDEIGALTSGFNDMAGQLESLVNNLEQRIQERTHSLEERSQQLMEAREKADQANRAKSAFLANMSHELRTPMNAILGFAQLMERDPNIPPKQRDNLGIITRSGEHLLGLINSVLEMSKIEAGQTMYQPAPFDLWQMLRGIEEMFRLRAAAKNLQLLFEREPDVPHYVISDEGKLRQVLINLLGNAIKFTAEGGVVLRLRRVQNRLHFEVEDTGQGIAPEEINRLFLAFSQTESGTKSQEGTGLGLAISKQFLELMDGSISVRSYLGEGTVFLFDIAFEEASLQDLPMEQKMPRVRGIDPADQREYRILIVDDKWENRQLMVEWLAGAGFKVREAENGKQAIETWEAWEPHLIWMDMRMPVMDGYEATRRIKSTTRGQSTVIIALTASAFEHEKAIVLSEGCDDFVRKPARESIIFSKIGEYLGVKFVYEEAVVPAGSTEEFELTADVIRGLSDDLVRRLRDSVQRLDIDQTQAVIEEIRLIHPAAAGALHDLVVTFRFDRLQELVLPQG